MTAYGLLTYTLQGDVASALPVVKWLSQQRNALGGFSSTQVLFSPSPLPLPWALPFILQLRCQWADFL